MDNDLKKEIKTIEKELNKKQDDINKIREKNIKGFKKIQDKIKFKQQLSEFFGGERAVTNEEYKQAILQMQKIRAETLEKKKKI